MGVSAPFTGYHSFAGLTYSPLAIPHLSSLHMSLAQSATGIPRAAATSLVLRPGWAATYLAAASSARSPSRGASPGSGATGGAPLLPTFAGAGTPVARQRRVPGTLSALPCSDRYFRERRTSQTLVGP